MLAITPWDKSFYYRQTLLSSFVSAKVERKNQTTKYFVEKFFLSPHALLPATTDRAYAYRDKSIVLQENSLGRSVDVCDAQIVLCRIS